MRLTKKIKVLIVDDSLLFRETLSAEIGKDFGIEVVGTADNPYTARDLILDLKPDVLTLDVQMPKMDGIEFLKKLMPQYPLPVIVVSSTGQKVFEALNAGAVDFVTKPDIYSSGGLKSFINELIVKIKIASIAKVSNHKKNYEVPDFKTNDDTDISKALIAIGASTGGTEAILSLLKALPRDMPGILVVQHMPPVFTKMYAERLNSICSLEVKEAEDEDAVKPGRVLIAPGEKQMILEKGRSGYRVKCFRGDKVNGHCPSVDVLFDSVAEVIGDKGIGVILTGMGSDGAKGLMNMKRKGAFTIGQDEKTSIVYGMPMVAFNIGAVQKQLPLEKIPQQICEYLNLLHHSKY